MVRFDSFDNSHKTVFKIYYQLIFAIRSVSTIIIQRKLHRCPSVNLFGAESNSSAGMCKNVEECFGNGPMWVAFTMDF